MATLEQTVGASFEGSKLENVYSWSFNVFRKAEGNGFMKISMKNATEEVLLTSKNIRQREFCSAT